MTKLTINELTQRALAKALGISAAMVCRLHKRGMPVDVEAARVWRAVNLDPLRIKGTKAPSSPSPRRPRFAQCDLFDVMLAARIPAIADLMVECDMTVDAATLAFAVVTGRVAEVSGVDEMHMLGGSLNSAQRADVERRVTALEAADG